MFLLLGSPGTPLLKQRPTADRLTALPESPLIRSGLKVDSPVPSKLGSSFFGAEAKPGWFIHVESF